LRIVDGAAEICQFVGAVPEQPLTFVDLAGESDAQAKAQCLIRQTLSQPFDLRAGPLFSWILLRQSPERFLWCQIYHHIAVDGFGRRLIAQRLAAIYNQLASRSAVASGEGSKLEDLIRDEEAYAASAEFAADRAFWMARCVDLGERASLAYRVDAAPARPLRQTIALDKNVTSALRTKARECGGSLPRLITAVAVSYLHRFTGVDEMLVGFQVASPRDRCGTRTPAMLTNTVPIRLHLEPTLGFDTLFAQCSAEIAASLQHQRFPWLTLRQALSLSPTEGDPFCLVVNYAATADRTAFAGAPTWTRNLARGPVQDLQVNVDDAPEEGGLLIDLDGNPALYPVAGASGAWRPAAARTGADCNGWPQARPRRTCGTRRARARTRRHCVQQLRSATTASDALRSVRRAGEPHARRDGAHLRHEPAQLCWPRWCSQPAGTPLDWRWHRAWQLGRYPARPLETISLSRS